MNNEYSIERAVLRQTLEKEFEAKIREYILDNGRDTFGVGRKYRYGGAHNFLATVQTVFKQLGEEFRCPDYETVAAAMEKVLEVSDLPFEHPSEVEDAYDPAVPADLANDERKCHDF